MKRIFLTGGSGFIGRNIKEQLSDKYELLAPSHAELELLDEQAVESYLKKKQPDVVIHAAVRPGHRNAKNPTNQLDRNCRMFFNLMRRADKFGKIIYLSSGLVYDQRFYQPKMKEIYFDAHVPLDEAGFSKYIISKYIEKVENAVELRLFGIFGKYEDYAIRFISNMICKALFGLPLTMKQNRRFDYLFIDDLMPVLEYFINRNGKHRAYNVTPDSSVELLSLAKKIGNLSGEQLPIKVDQPGLGPEYSGDNLRLHSEIKGLSFTSVDEAVERLFKWYQAEQARLDKTCLLHDK